MNDKDEQFIILEQYRIYSDAKEKFIERQFRNNRYYLVMNLVILVAIYFIGAIIPQQHPVIVLSVIGIIIALMWWMNIDSYQTLIKVKYAKVLEYLETKLPEQPYHKEYVDYTQLKKNKKLIVFDDFQKFLTIAIICIYFYVCAQNLINVVRIQMM